ncbi:MAG: hypothetical protein K9L70_04240 [Thiohalocapsa sp.]|nr:hypothetical protein [Thiohalocapsa sp.]MCF7991708.1 hypothetical protein [Thiohalocapsa sp.]
MMIAARRSAFASTAIGSCSIAMRAARAVLELLEDSGWLRAESSPARQKPRFRVHPKLILSQMNQQHR